MVRKCPEVAREEKCRSEQGSMGKAITWWQGWQRAFPNPRATTSTMPKASSVFEKSVPVLLFLLDRGQSRRKDERGLNSDKHHACRDGSIDMVMTGMCRAMPCHAAADQTSRRHVRIVTRNRGQDWMVDAHIIHAPFRHISNTQASGSLGTKAKAQLPACLPAGASTHTNGLTTGEDEKNHVQKLVRPCNDLLAS